jgi:hypothetical protein
VYNLPAQCIVKSPVSEYGALIHISTFFISIITFIFHFTAQCLLHIPPSLTSKLPTFFPHGEFKRLVHISEKQQLFSLQQLQKSFHNLEEACLLHGVI